MDSIDKLLSEIKAEYQQKSNSQPEKIEELEEVKKIKSKSSVPSSSFCEYSRAKIDAVDNILSEVKQEFEQKQLLDEQQKQQELEKERIQLEVIKAKQIEAFKIQAQEWLEQLEPLSPEGLWFESFAQSYPSKLEAAIEYLHGE